MSSLVVEFFASLFSHQHNLPIFPLHTTIVLSSVLDSSRFKMEVLKSEIELIKRQIQHCYELISDGHGPTKPPVHQRAGSCNHDRGSGRHRLTSRVNILKGVHDFVNHRSQISRRGRGGIKGRLRNSDCLIPRDPSFCWSLSTCGHVTRVVFWAWNKEFNSADLLWSRRP